MLKVKIFRFRVDERTVKKVEEEINIWFAEKAESIEVVSFLQSSFGVVPRATTVISVWYEERANIDLD